MRSPRKDQKDTIFCNGQITIENIPAEAYEYVVNGKSAIEWIMDRYQITTHKESGIRNDPNDWATIAGDFLLRPVDSINPLRNAVVKPGNSIRTYGETTIKAGNRFATFGEDIDLLENVGVWLGNRIKTYWEAIKISETRFVSSGKGINVLQNTVVKPVSNITTSADPFP